MKQKFTRKKAGQISFNSLKKLFGNALAEEIAMEAAEPYSTYKPKAISSPKTKARRLGLKYNEEEKDLKYKALYEKAKIRAKKEGKDRYFKILEEEGFKYKDESYSPSVTSIEKQIEIIKDRESHANQVKNPDLTRDYLSLLEYINENILHNIPFLQAYQIKRKSRGKGIMVFLDQGEKLLAGIHGLHITFINNSVHITFDYPQLWNKTLPTNVHWERFYIDQYNMSLNYDKLDDSSHSEWLIQPFKKQGKKVYYSSQDLARALFNKYIKDNWRAEQIYSLPILEEFIIILREIIERINIDILSNSSRQHLINKSLKLAGNKKYKKHKKNTRKKYF